MASLVLVSVTWLHMALVVLWLGGIAFIGFILPLALSNMLPEEIRMFNQAVRSKFVPFAWIYIILIAITGVFRLNLDPADLSSLTGSATSYGRTLTLKLGIFALIIILSIYITRKFKQLSLVESPSEARVILNITRLVSTVNIVLGFIMVILAVGLSEGGLF